MLLFFVSRQNVPLGYTVPGFPALYWPVGATHPDYETAVLYYSHDMWAFTVYWTMIFFLIAYLLAGVASATNLLIQRARGSRHVGKCLSALVLAVYCFLGPAQGFVTGAVVGLVLLAIYRAGYLAMPTWIPFSWGLALVVYHICSSYSTSLLLI